MAQVLVAMEESPAKKQKTDDEGKTMEVKSEERICKGWIEPDAFDKRCRFCNMVLSSSQTNQELCMKLQSNGAIKDRDLLEAWLSVDRADFCPEGSDAYADAAVYMGYGAQVSAPHVHARGLQFIVEYLKQIAGNEAPIRILEIGSGCGIMSAVLARLLVMLRGKEKAASDAVLSVEHISELVQDSIVNVQKHHTSLLKEHGGPLEIKCGDGTKLAGQLDGGIDIIYSGCDFNGIEEGAGKDLYDLLKKGGRFVSPLGPQDKPQTLSIIDKLQDGTPSVTKDIIVFFTPAEQGAEEQRRRGQNWKESAEKRIASFTGKL